MTKLEYFKELKEALIMLMSNSKKYSFSDFQLPNNNFAKYSQEYLVQKLKYKDDYWFVINDEDFSIELTLPIEIKKFFQDNKIPKYIMGLDANDFEIVSSILFKKIFNNLLFEKNRQGCDDGIDFYGYYSSDGEVRKWTNFFQKNTWYIGQVKKYSYKNTIGTKYIRELLGTIELAKQNIWSLKDSYSNINIQGSEAINPIFLTSSRYSDVVIDISKRLGIKLLDDIDLIFWLTILYEGNLDMIKSDLKKWSFN
jgi:hypothetical protein